MVHLNGHAGGRREEGEREEGEGGEGRREKGRREGGRRGKMSDMYTHSTCILYEAVLPGR